MKAVLFDLDNTLYSYQPCHEEGISRVLEYLNKEWKISLEEANNYYNQGRDWIHKQLLNTGASHHRLLYMSKLAEFAGQSPIRYAKKLEDIYWDGYFSKMVLFEGVVELLKSLKESGILTGIVTDLVAEIQYRKLNYLGLEDSFDAIVTSEEAGVEKPSPVIFLLALEKLGLNSPQDAVMVGDSYSKDILGANALGMKAFWINGGFEKASEKVVMIRDFEELKKLFGKKIENI